MTGEAVVPFGAFSQDMECSERRSERVLTTGHECQKAQEGRGQGIKEWETGLYSLVNWGGMAKKIWTSSGA